MFGGSLNSHHALLSPVPVRCASCDMKFCEKDKRCGKADFLDCLFLPHTFDRKKMND